MHTMVLGIDTAGSGAGGALVTETQVLASFYLHRPPAFSRDLLRLIATMCAQAGYEPSAIAHVAVNLGPGAFTGLRVGLATAQGLAMAYDKPLIGISAFEALVELVGDWEGIVCPILEARRGEVYAAFYRRRGKVVQEIIPGMAVTPEILCTLVTERTLFLGSGVASYGALLAATLGEWAYCVETGIEVGIAVGIARLGERRMGLAAPEMPTILTPLYIRAADAHLPPHVVGAQRTALAPTTTRELQGV